MKASLTAAAIALAISAIAPTAHAERPRASSENNWPGIATPGAVTGYAYPVYQSPLQSTAVPRYVWKEGYSHGGQWQGGWVIER